jgi:alpha-mannosidase
VPTTWSFARLEPAPLVMSAIVVAVDGKGVIVRWYNPSDTEVIADLATLVPCARATQVMLNEEPLRALAGEADAPERHWRIPTPAGGIISVRLEPSNGH